MTTDIIAGAKREIKFVSAVIFVLFALYSIPAIYLIANGNAVGWAMIAAGLIAWALVTVIHYTSLKKG